MPVARDDLGDFLGADAGAQQARPALIALGLGGGLGRADLGGLQARLQVGQLAVLQLGQLVELALALQLGHLGAHAVDLFLDGLRALHGGLFSLPDFLEVVVLALQLFELVLDHAQAALGGIVGFLLDGLALDLELDDATVELVHHFRLGIDFHADARAGLVDQVDGLVGQEAVGDVAVRQLGRGHDGRVGDLDAVVDLVAFLQAAQDGDGRFHVGLVDQHLLEAALQRGVLLDVLAVFVQRGRADAMQLAAPSAGLSMLPASIAPSALPAPTMVCNSSMKTMLLPSSCASSFSTAFRRSSNSPRNLAPASARPGPATARACRAASRALRR